MLSLLLALAAAACAEPLEERAIPPADMTRFVVDVYPMLLANCAFSTCHGDGNRPFRIYGPGRTRLDPELDMYAPATAEEIAFSYARARSMLVDPEGPRRSPLLRKPLAVSAGGAKHAGDDPWGRALIASKRDPRYEAMFFWAIGDRWGEEEAP